MLSSEIFELLHVNAIALSNLKKILNDQGLEVTVVVFFRDKLEYANSLYKELVNHGLDVSPEDFVAMILDSNRFVYKNRCYSFNYSNITDGFAQIFGTKNVIILKYGNNVIEEFSKITGIKLDTSIKLNSSSSNTATAVSNKNVEQNRASGTDTLQINEAYR